jgi:hypothetical protein
MSLDEDDDVPSDLVIHHDAPSPTPCRVITLNVGGQSFHTTLLTLTAHSAYFRTVLQNGLLEDGPLFIDRDPGLFTEVLRYLRDGRYNPVAAGDDDSARDNLRREFEFYGIEPMPSQLDHSDLLLTMILRNLGPKLYLGQYVRFECPSLGRVPPQLLQHIPGIYSGRDLQRLLGDEIQLKFHDTPYLKLPGVYDCATLLVAEVLCCLRQFHPRVVWMDPGAHNGEDMRLWYAGAMVRVRVPRGWVVTAQAASSE